MLHRLCNVMVFHHKELHKLSEDICVPVSIFSIIKYLEFLRGLFTFFDEALLTNEVFCFRLKEKLDQISTKGFIIMTMNRAFYLRKEDSNPQWKIIDATDKILGRLATEVADVLRGKDKAYYTAHTDCGDYVVIINADKIKLTGNKWDDKIYTSYS